MTERKVYHEGDISDWRIAENGQDDLTQAQQKPWPVKIGEGGWGGLLLEFTAPDGTSRSVVVEIDKGNVKLVTFRDQDESDAIITIQADGTHVQSNQGGHPAYLFGDDGVRRAPTSPTPSFAEDAATPEPR